MITKPKLLEFLNQNTDYKEADEYLVDEVIYNLKLIKEAKQAIKKHGLLINVSNNPDKDYYQKNQALSIYDASVKNVLNISRKLGLSVFDRKNLNIEVNTSDDGF